MKISMTFQGHVTAEVTHLTDTKTLERVDITQMSPTEVKTKLNMGELLMSLRDSLDNSDGDEEIELDDFDVDPA